MNIQNRVKKIEDSIGGDNKPFVCKTFVDLYKAVDLEAKGVKVEYSEQIAVLLSQLSTNKKN